MNITVVGLGYVGISNAVLLAQKNKVTAVDIINEKVEKVNNRQSPIRDKEIEKYLKTRKLQLVATMDEKAAYKNADFIIIATPTDYDTEKGQFDTSSIEKVIHIVKEVNSDAVVVIRSTIPIGYTEYIHKEIYEKTIFAPEFIREGKALYDNLYPSRIIVSAPKGNQYLVEKAQLFTRILCEGALKRKIDCLLVGTSEAEAIKLYSNAYLALRVAFFNELDTFAESKQLDTKEIIKGVCLDNRIGDIYNNPSFGYGGYCLSKDTKQLMNEYKDIPNIIIKGIVSSNEVRKTVILNRILEKCKDRHGVVGIFRLNMKVGADNIRQSSILDILTELIKKDINVIIYEPLCYQDMYHGVSVISDLEYFKKTSNIIIANRISPEINDVQNKVYTRDIFGSD